MHHRKSVMLISVHCEAMTGKFIKGSWMVNKQFWGSMWLQTLSVEGILNVEMVNEISCFQITVGKQKNSIYIKGKIYENREVRAWLWSEVWLLST